MNLLVVDAIAMYLNVTTNVATTMSALVSAVRADAEIPADAAVLPMDTAVAGVRLRFVRAVLVDVVRTIAAVQMTIAVMMEWVLAVDAVRVRVRRNHVRQDLVHRARVRRDLVRLDLVHQDHARRVHVRQDLAVPAVVCVRNHTLIV